MSQAPESCPGPAAPDAGRSSRCAGCPNASRCASGQGAPVNPDIALIAEHLKDVKHIILVLSGKGGVGKSTVSVQTAFWLSEQCNKQVGLLDIDICGPSIPTMTHTCGEPVHSTAGGLWEPVGVTENLCAISIAHMLERPDAAVAWRGPRKTGMITQFLKQVAWGALDYLIIDTPPGTSDEHMSIIELLKDCGVDGCIIVTTPQEVAIADVRREINFAKLVGLKVLGVVENMAGMVCPCCNKDVTLFYPSSGGADKMCEEYNIPKFGRIPMDPVLASAADRGLSWAAAAAEAEANANCGESLGVARFREVVENLRKAVGDE